jgi:hypothetical protein
MAKRIDLSLNEDLTAENIEKAHASLENGGTKKAACEILNIKYNTKRLDNIIHEYFERKERTKRIRAQKRKEAILTPEKAEIISAYLAGDSVTDISDSHYRSVAVINRVLEDNGAKIRAAQTDYFNPIEFPEECLADGFSVGDIAWSARFNCLVEIMSKLNEFTYRVWVSGAHEQQSYHDLGDLGCLDHLKALGVQLKAGFLPSDEIKMAISLAFKNSRTTKLKEE